MPEIGEKFYRSTLVSPDVAPGNDGGGEEYMAKVKTPNQHNGVKLFLESYSCLNLDVCVILRNAVKSIQIFTLHQQTVFHMKADIFS